MAIKVGINGYGRIGRCIVRALHEQGRTDEIDVVAINDLGDVETNAHLTRYDSTHGRFPAEVALEGDRLRVGDREKRLTRHRSLEHLDWRRDGVDLVLDGSEDLLADAEIVELVACGCHLTLFTTGRGSAYGCKPAPSIKLATNSDMYNRMSEDMDINCGEVLDGVSLEEKGQEIFEHILRTASGEKTKSEQLGYGDNEFVPWQVGAVM